MTKIIFHILVAIIACSILSPAAFGAKGLKSSKTPTIKSDAANRKEKVTLEIAGATDSQAAAALQQAFAANGLTATVKENKKGGKPLRVEGQIDTTTDLSAWSKAVASAAIIKRGQTAPAVEVVYYAPLTKENQTQVLAQLEKIKGVDARNSTIDGKKGAVRVRISGTDPVTAEDISNAVKSAGVVGHFAKTTKTKKF